MKTFRPNDLMYPEHPSDILSRAAYLADEDCHFALITSLEIEGGAAREVGSLAIVEKTGSMTGYLSNGCIDRDIQHHALDALQSGQKKLIRYGDGARYADLKLPCGGALSVLIDPAPDIQAINQAAGRLIDRKPVNLLFEVMEDVGTLISKRFTYTPRHRLVLAGRGAIFRAMAQVGYITGFDVHLLSPETEDLAAVSHLSGLSPIHLTTPNSGQALRMLDAYSAFVTLFHDHDWEPSLLNAALKTPACFIGSLGSRRTHEMRRETLRQMGISEASLSRLRGPIGLVPSLRDAPSIALSTLAEVIAAFRVIDGSTHLIES